MECFKCGSFRIIRFVDGFGDKRVFCRGCTRSFLDGTFMPQVQTKLPDFSLNEKREMVGTFRR